MDDLEGIMVSKKKPDNEIHMFRDSIYMTAYTGKSTETEEELRLPGAMRRGDERWLPRGMRFL